ncbi:MAG TPA: hypothetical protein VFU92_08050 [Usitatibacter sp.]|nr:hypothetical protein [Usitatibacter sp.]
MTRFAAVAIALLLAGCAARPPQPGAFVFGVLGDTPYSEREEAAFLGMIERMNREPLAFSIHVGDIKGAGACSDELFHKRLAEFNRFKDPLIYTPGDNEWTDCRRKHMGSGDPIDALARLRTTFFSEPRSLGMRRIDTAMQVSCDTPPPSGCGCAYPENRRWTHGPIVFTTLDVPGSDNNVGYDARNDEEARCRNAANARWLDQAAAEAAAPGVRALVIAIQANPWDSKKPVYDALKKHIEAVYARLDKPVLFIHGDTHIYRVDYPFGVPVRRLETYGSPFVGWVRVTVDPSKPELFTFEPELYKFVPP